MAKASSLTTRFLWKYIWCLYFCTICTIWNVQNLLASDTQQIKTAWPFELGGGGDEKGSGPIHTHLFIAREPPVLLPGDGSMG